VLRGWSEDEDKVRLTLLAVHEIEEGGASTSQAEFVAALAQRLGWQGATRYEMGRVLTSLVRKGYIRPIRQGGRGRGYTLGDRGREVIEDLLAAQGGQEAPSGASDLGQLLLDVAGPARQWTEAAAKLEANRARRAELLAEIARLDEEAQALGRVLGDPEVQALVRSLLDRLRRAPPG
jgi:DNA-binding PadR family transcriptional regulator